MILSAPKIQSLWKRLNSLLSTNSNLLWALKKIGASEDVSHYGNSIFRSLDTIWDYQLPDILKNSQITANEKDCPRGIHDGGSDEVRRRLVENADIGEKQDREVCLNMVWGKLSRIKGNRVSDFRIASNADGFSSFETFNTTVTQSNPDPWVYSYNFPWHIISWLKDIHDGNTPAYQFVYGDSQEDVLFHKFSMKYLWMIACRDVIPILSLRSFLNLTPFFEELIPSFRSDYGLFPNRWQQSFDDFQHKWRFLSQKICSVLEVDQNSFPEIRERLGLFIFCVSLMGNATCDLGTLLQTGNGAVILYGPPGTGKTYTAKNAIFPALGIPPGKEEDYKKKDVYGLRYETDLGDVTLVQFHPNYSYQDFVGGIFPGVDETTKNIYYEIHEGVFKKLCDRAARAIANNEKKTFYLIIDEINRADLSAVFGELMFGLEYRNFTMDIPIFGAFSIPDNVYIIGTMNNTDKSLAGFDLALRRRFAFLHIVPDMDVIANAPFVRDTDADSEDEIDVAREFANRADALNEQLANRLHLPREKQIGHAYFLKAKDFCESITVQTTEDDSVTVRESKAYKLTEYALEQLWEYHLQPLLEEFLGLEAEEPEKVAEMNEMKTAFCKPFLP